MEIQLHGEYTEQDLRRGLALVGMSVWHYLGFGIFLVLVIGVLPTIISDRSSGEAEANYLLRIWLPFVFALPLFGLFLWWTPRRQARQAKKDPWFQGTISGVATDEALELRGEQSEGKTKWEAFVQYKMSGEVVVLCQNNAAVSIVPRSLFANDEDWQQFRQFVQATVPAKAKTQGGILRWRWILYLILALMVLGAFLLTYLGSR
jgi:hypothetical protein